MPWHPADGTWIDDAAGTGADLRRRDGEPSYGKGPAARVWSETEGRWVAEASPGVPSTAAAAKRRVRGEPSEWRASRVDQAATGDGRKDGGLGLLRMSGRVGPRRGTVGMASAENQPARRAREAGEPWHWETLA